MKKIIVEYEDEKYQLLVGEFDENIEIEDLLKIDYSNLLGEIITFPVVLNRFGIILAKLDNAIAEKKLSIDILESKIKNDVKTDAEEKKDKKPTVEDLNIAVSSNKAYQALKRALIHTQLMRDEVNSVYWAMKDKADNLKNLSTTLQRDDIVGKVFSGSINEISVKKINNNVLIK